MGFSISTFSFILCFLHGHRPFFFSFQDPLLQLLRVMFFGASPSGSLPFPSSSLVSSNPPCFQACQVAYPNPQTLSLHYSLNHKKFHSIDLKSPFTWVITCKPNEKNQIVPYGEFMKGFECDGHSFRFKFTIQQKKKNAKASILLLENSNYSVW